VGANGKSNALEGSKSCKWDAERRRIKKNG